MSFVEDNLLTPNGNIRHHGEIPENEEEFSHTPKHSYTHLSSLINKDLPALVNNAIGQNFALKHWLPSNQKYHRPLIIF